jgi:hypothetical protein
MQVSTSEVAVMYARACFAWYGKNKALKIARDNIRRLKRRGLVKDAEMWAEIASAVGELNDSDRIRGLRR